MTPPKAASRDDAAVALARPAGLDEIDEHARARRHHADAVRQQRGLVERVGDQQDGGAGLAPQLEQLVAHQQPGLLVERAERLVEQQQARPRHQGAGDAEPLAHAAGELRRIGLRKRRQAHEGERMLDALADFRLGHAGAAQRERGVVVDGEPGKARVLLEHHADAVRHLAGDRLALEVIVPAVGRASPAITSSRVDLPQPDGPTTEKNSPCRRSRSSGPSA